MSAISRAQRQTLTKLAKESADVFELPLAQFASILDLPSDLLSGIQAAGDPLRGEQNLPSDYAEFQGKKSLKLWCLMESYGYELTQMPKDPVAFLEESYQPENDFPTITPAQARKVCELFIIMGPTGVAKVVDAAKAAEADFKVAEAAKAAKAKDVPRFGRQAPSSPKKSNVASGAAPDATQDFAVHDGDENDFAALQHGADHSPRQKQPTMAQTAALRVAAAANAVADVSEPLINLGVVMDKIMRSHIADAEKKVNDLFVRFTQTLMDRHQIEKEEMIEIWAEVAGSSAKAIQDGLDKEATRKEREAKKAAEKAKLALGPRCGYPYGPKAKRANELCGEPCKDKKIYTDPKTGRQFSLCGKHNKTGIAKQTCDWVYDESAPKKKGTICACRCSKAEYVVTDGKGKWVKSKDEKAEPEQFDREGVTVDGLIFVGRWLCVKHIEAAHKALDRADHQCTHVGKKGDKKRCDKGCKKLEDGTWLAVCGKHEPKKNKKSGKKAADQRKALKKGKGKAPKHQAKKDKSKSKAKKEAESDSESEDESTESKAETKADKESTKSKGKAKPAEETKAVEEVKQEAAPATKRPTKSGGKPAEVKEDPKPAKSGGKVKAVAEDESDAEDEDPEKTQVIDDEDEDEKLMVEENFSSKPTRKAKWVIRTTEDEDKNAFYFFVDANSGLVAWNEDNADAEELDEAALVPLGTWDNESQEYAELSEKAKKYAKKLGLKINE